MAFLLIFKNGFVKEIYVVVNIRVEICIVIKSYSEKLIVSDFSLSLGFWQTNLSNISIGQ